MITKKVYEEIRKKGCTEYTLQLGDFIIQGRVSDDPELHRIWYRYRNVSVRYNEKNLKKYPENEGREAGPEYERIFQLLIDSSFCSEYWKYLGKYGRKAVENYKKDPTRHILEPRRFDMFYNEIPKDIQKFNIQPMKDDEDETDDE